jgi:DNA modification methylase
MTSKKLTSIEFNLTCPICTEKVPSLQDHVQSSHSDQEIKDAIFTEKAKGVSDIEIGRKYGVTFRYIEKLVTHREGVNISQLGLVKKVKRLTPRDFHEEQTSVWSFKSRGDWATHSGEYRGNWSPYIPRNVILKYSKEGETVLDYFCGAGTTAVEAKLLGRKCIAFDINDAAIELAKKNVAFDVDMEVLKKASGPIPQQTHEPNLFVGDARDLSCLEDNSIDLICAHPPYANIIHYTPGKEGDLSFLEVSPFLEEMRKVARESFRVLKPGRQCAILIGDTRQKRHVVPIGSKLINVYLDAGFKLKELVIKRQHNCKTTGFWYANSIKYNFLLLAHEYLPIFEKPLISKKTSSLGEKTPAYGSFYPEVTRPPLKKELRELESTTVWIFPENDLESRLNENVIDRYSSRRRYVEISLTSSGGGKARTKTVMDTSGSRDLVFLKSPCLEFDLVTKELVKSYLRQIQEIVSTETKRLVKEGFLSIQTRDVRINGYIEPLAKHILDQTIPNELKLKEIIVVTTDGTHTESEIPLNHGDLRITHQYLLVYRKV